MNKLFDSLAVRNHLPAITAPLVMGAALNVFSLAAVAQTAQAPMDAGIEVITVTAEKRSTLLQETPVAVTALTADKLESGRIDTFSDLMLHVPSLTYTQFSPQESYISIRGTLINNNAAGWDDAVTTFIDGVPSTGLGDQNPDLFDLQQIEVLRGPQGTLFGRNVTGGAIVLRTLEPSFDPHAKVRITYGNDNFVQARGYLTGPVDDAVAAKLSVDANHRDAFIDNTTLGGKTAGTDEAALRGQLLWRPYEQLSVLFGADFMRDNSGGYPSRLQANFRPVLFPNLSFDANTTNQGFNGFQHREVGGGLARVRWQTAHGELTSVTGYRNVDNHFPNSVLGDPANQLLQTNIVQDQQYSEELDFTSPADDRLTWVAGLFYLHSHKRQGGPQVTAFDPATVAGSFASVNNYTQSAIQRIGTDSYAIFGQAAFSITPAFTFTLGGRETSERKSGTSSIEYSIVDPAHLFPAAVGYAQSWNSFTPKGVLSWRASDALMWYASVTRGFKSGGFDLSGAGASHAADVGPALATPFAPETETSYEVGGKYLGLGNRLAVNAAIFRADYANQQVSQLVLLRNSQFENITSNAPGTSRSQGVELESTAVATDWLSLGVTYAYLSAKFPDGSAVPYTPRNQVNLSGDVHFPAPSLGGSLSLAADYTYHSRIIFNKGDAYPGYIAGQTAWNRIINMHLDYLSEGQRWRTSIWGKNIANDRALLRASNVGVLFENLAEFANPDNSLYLVKYFPERTFGVSVTRDF
jgi:iron complex outermembrane recepter protein